MEVIKIQLSCPYIFILPVSMFDIGQFWYERNRPPKGLLFLLFPFIMDLVSHSFQTSYLLRGLKTPFWFNLITVSFNQSPQASQFNIPFMLLSSIYYMIHTTPSNVVSFKLFGMTSTETNNRIMRFYALSYFN